jgi:molybdopterin converting factor subunit 1
MKVRLRFFASLREQLRMSEREIELPERATVRRIWNDLCAEHPGLERFGVSVSFAVNREYADGDTDVNDGDEVAFIPPVSGG